MARNGVRIRVALALVLVIALLLLIGMTVNVKLITDQARYGEQTNFANELTGLSQTATARGR